MKNEKAKRKHTPACPNCTKPITRSNEGCVLHDLIQVVRERGTVTERKLRNIHVAVDANKFWDVVGKIVDSLEYGEYSE